MTGTPKKYISSVRSTARKIEAANTAIAELEDELVNLEAVDKNKADECAELIEQVKVALILMVQNLRRKLETAGKREDWYDAATKLVEGLEMNQIESANAEGAYQQLSDRLANVTEKLQEAKDEVDDMLNHVE
jgi:hypothetical protein